MFNRCINARALTFPTPLIDSRSSFTRILAIASCVLESSSTASIVISPDLILLLISERNFLDSDAFLRASLLCSVLSCGGVPMNQIYTLNQISSDAMAAARSRIALGPIFQPSVMGRPITTKLAPVDIAAIGVIVLT